MGERRARREKFFTLNPVCCFCGGASPATTEDHQPARTLFKGRVWPEGFVFPACDACNAASREAEKAVSLLIHGESSSDERGKYQQLVASIRNDYPGLIASMFPKSSNEVRGILRSKGISKPANLAIRDVPIVKLDKIFWEPQFAVFSRKLLLAFRYQCFGRPLSPSGGLCHWIGTNVDFASKQFPEEILHLAERLALPQRQNARLDDQFSVRWNIVPEHNTALFVAQFHQRLVISGITTETPDKFSNENQDRMVGPWEWPAS